MIVAINEAPTVQLPTTMKRNGPYGIAHGGCWRKLCMFLLLDADGSAPPAECGWGILPCLRVLGIRALGDGPARGCGSGVA